MGNSSDGIIRKGKKVCSAPSYEALVEENVMVPTRDGTGLATDIYFPSLEGQRAEGKFPVVLTRTPYNKRRSIELIDGRYFAERGYIAAIQDVRGRFSSEGEFYPFRNEGPDGYDAVEWLAEQPWCDGKIGTFGESYCAATQSALACLNPPHLSAMIVTYGPSSYYHSSMRHNGVLELRFFSYAFMMAANSKEAFADETLQSALKEAYANIWDWIKAGPIRRGESPLRHVPTYEEWCIDIYTRVLYDEYWKTPGYGPKPFYDSHADVPTLYVGGWYDTYPKSTLENFSEMSKRQKSPVCALMGPWTHNGVGGVSAGDVLFGPEAGLSEYRGVQLQWFDRWLKELPSGAGERNSVKYFVMGGGGLEDVPGKLILHGGGWKKSDAWPPEDAEPEPFYLHTGGLLSKSPPDEEFPPEAYNFDPSDPVPTIGGQLSAIPLPQGGYDQRNDPRFASTSGTLSLSARRDVLCFSTPPLESAVEVAGPVFVKLWVSTDGFDTDFTAKLIDVFPPSEKFPEGCALGLVDGIARLRFRNSWEKEEPAEPGKAYPLSFELYPTANLFAEGHRIRVDISSSNYPRFEVNPNTGGVLGKDRRMRVAENALYYSRTMPSHVILYVVRSQGFRAGRMQPVERIFTQR